jgi:hypothetical protein
LFVGGRVRGALGTSGPYQRPQLSSRPAAPGGQCAVRLRAACLRCAARVSFWPAP